MTNDALRSTYFYQRQNQQLLILLRVGPRKMQGLDRYFTLQMRIARQIDNALRTAAQFADDFETPDALAHATPCNEIANCRRSAF